MSVLEFVARRHPLGTAVVVAPSPQLVATLDLTRRAFEGATAQATSPLLRAVLRPSRWALGPATIQATPARLLISIRPLGSGTVRAMSARCRGTLTTTFRALAIAGGAPSSPRLRAVLHIAHQLLGAAREVPTAPRLRSVLHISRQALGTARVRVLPRMRATLGTSYRTLSSSRVRVWPRLRATLSVSRRALGPGTLRGTPGRLRGTLALSFRTLSAATVRATARLTSTLDTSFRTLSAATVRLLPARVWAGAELAGLGLTRLRATVARVRGTLSTSFRALGAGTLRILPRLRGALLTSRQSLGAVRIRVLPRVRATLGLTYWTARVRILPRVRATLGLTYWTARVRVLPRVRGTLALSFRMSRVRVLARLRGTLGTTFRSFNPSRVRVGPRLRATLGTSFRSLSSGRVRVQPRLRGALTFGWVEWTGYHYVVAPAGGSSSGTAGTVGDPFSLAYACAGAGGRIVAGKIVAIRGALGTYSGIDQYAIGLNGAVGPGLDNPASKIIFRSFPGERAKIDGQVRVNGSYVWLWGLEVFNSDPVHKPDPLVLDGYGIVLHGRGLKVINCLTHDAKKSGAYTNGTYADEAELYGMLSWNNGTELNLDHGAYIHATSTTLRVRVRECAVWNNLAYGLHCYEQDVDMRNIDLVGCIGFNNGRIRPSQPYTRPGIILSSNQGTLNDVSVTDCLGYHSLASDYGDIQLGSPSALAHGKIVVTGCYFGGGLYQFFSDTGAHPFTDATIQNNKFVPRATTDRVVYTIGAIGAYGWSGNTHYMSAALTRWNHDQTLRDWNGWKVATGLGAGDTVTGALRTTTDVFVRPNAYAPGARGHVVIFNWSLAATVAVDLSAILPVGALYEIRSLSHLTGAPLLSGLYLGGTVLFPMTGVTPDNPIGLARAFTAPPTTAPEFDAFLVQRVG